MPFHLIFQGKSSSMAIFLCFCPSHFATRSPILSPTLTSPSIHPTLSKSSPFPTNPISNFSNQSAGKRIPCSRARALREWQEYEAAVKEKDLARALRFLKDMPIVLEDSSSVESTRSQINGGELGLFGLERDWEVLDTCLNADDMRLVGSAYSFLKDRGFLPNFGKYRNIGIFI